MFKKNKNKQLKGSVFGQSEREREWQEMMVGKEAGQDHEANLPKTS